MPLSQLVSGSNLTNFTKQDPTTLEKTYQTEVVKTKNNQNANVY